jgi:hypothetical protein
MSTLKVNKIRDTSGSADAITFDPNGGAVLAGVTTISTARITTGITTSIQVGGGVTISESGIEASGIGITVANINGTQIGGRRNRVQNGDIRITQRYGTDAHTPSNTSRNYVMDRWAYWSNQTSKASIQQVEDGPAGFKFSAKITSLAATSAGSGDWFALLTTIEAQDLYDLEQGTANAKDFTLSFYVKSSVTGTWAAAVRTRAGSPDRSYPFNYTINSANTWERKTITIPGSTDGTWLTGTAEGICLWFDLGSGSAFHQTANQWYGGNSTGPSASPFIAVNAATFYLTGVQLEAGTQATAFEHRSFGEELALCQRYFLRLSPATSYAAYGVGGAYSDTQAVAQIHFPVPMRASPTFSYNGALNTFYDVIGGFVNFSAMTVSQIMGSSIVGYTSAKVNVVGSGTGGNTFMLATFNNTDTYLNFDSEF